jgi:steroid 5-alpha reductase family enzyme
MIAPAIGAANAPLLTPFLVGLAAVLAVVTCLWWISLRPRNVTVIDVFWGPGFALSAWIYASFGGFAPRRSALLLALITIWALRLAIFLFRRSHGQPEDARYAAMRVRHGIRFARVSLRNVFLLQGLLIAVISTPLLLALVRPGPPSWLWSDTVGLGLWLLGFTFEAVGDWQLARFRLDPENRGKVLQTGLWRYTRHPNYFGNAAMWWGYWFFALASPGGFFTVASVVLMTVLLLKVSGVALLEKTIGERRPGYREYVAATSAFLPWFRRRR